MARLKRHAQAIGSLTPMISVLAVAAVVFIVIMFAIGEPAFAAAPGAAFVLLFVLAGMDSLLARHELARHDGDLVATARDEGGSAPVIPITRGGVPEQVHERLDPVDIPAGHPLRRTLRRAAHAA